LLSYAPLISCFSQAIAVDVDLRKYETSFYSPNGEDGILAEIYKWIKPSSYFCVDLGAYDGFTNSMTYLLRQQGWNGLLLDKSFDIPIFNLHKEFITAENVNMLLEKYHTPYVFDLLIVDLGYNDFYIWQAIAELYQPTVVCIGYNSLFTPKEDKIAIYHPYFCGENNNYFGASILALCRLGKTKGYELIYSEQTGEHLFFIREDVLRHSNIRFIDANDLEKLYPVVSNQNKPGRSIMDPKNRKYISSCEVLKK
jgi:hypothetical protein